MTECDLFDPVGLADEIEGFARKVRATKSVGRVVARRAASEKALADVLPSRLENGDHWHILTAGDVDAISYAAHFLNAPGPCPYMLFSTWCLATADIELMKGWLDTGRVGRIDAYVGEIFPGSYPSEYAALRPIIESHGGRVGIFRNHSKVFLLRIGNQFITIQSSANINTNPRCENSVMVSDEAVFDHHKRYFDEVRNFKPNPAGWQPWNS